MVLPLGVFMIVLLFPFYWMTITAFKSNEELLNFRDFNPLWVANPTLANIRKLFFDTDYPIWLWNTMLIAVAATDRNGARAYYSNFGAVVALAAPGGDMRGNAASGILSTLNAGSGCDLCRGGAGVDAASSCEVISGIP